MTTNSAPSAAQKLIGEIAPKLADLTDEVLFGDVWERPQLSTRDGGGGERRHRSRGGVGVGVEHEHLLVKLTSLRRTAPSP